MWLRLEKLGCEDAREIIHSEMMRGPHLASKLRCVGEARWPELYDETRGSPLALMHTLELMRVRVVLTFDDALEMLRGNRTPDLEKFISREKIIARRTCGGTTMLKHRVVSHSSAFVGSAVHARTKLRMAEMLAGRSGAAAPSALSMNPGPMLSRSSFSMSAPAA